jgi:hypothetical protein
MQKFLVVLIQVWKLLCRLYELLCSRFQIVIHVAILNFKPRQYELRHLHSGNDSVDSYKIFRQNNRFSVKITDISEIFVKIKTSLCFRGNIQTYSHATFSPLVQSHYPTDFSPLLEVKLSGSCGTVKFRFVARALVESHFSVKLTEDSTQRRTKSVNNPLASANLDSP